MEEIIEKAGATDPNVDTEIKAEFTDEQKAIIADMIKRESDRRVSQALKTQEKKFSKQLSLSQLDDNARAQAEKDDRIAELEEQVKQFNILSQKNEVMKTLSSRGLNSQIADVLAITDDEVENQKVIETFDKVFKAAVKAEVDKRLNSNVPKKDLPTDKAITKEMFRKMSISEQAELFKNNPDIYKSLIQ